MNEANRPVEAEAARRVKVGSVVSEAPRSAENGAREATDTHPAAKAAGPERALSRPRPQTSKPEPHTGFQRTAAAIRTMLPLVRKVLPLLDGNVASVVANFLAPQMQPPPVDIHPVEVGLARLHAEISVLHDKNAEHDATLKRIGQQLESMKSALESAATDQYETRQRVKRIEKKLLFFSLLGLSLLAANVILLFHMGQALH
jgi:hypothetical protein